MFSGINMTRLVGGGNKADKGENKVAASKSKSTGNGRVKRKAELSPKKMEPAAKKRSALGDLTNATKKKALGKEESVKGLLKPGEKPVMTRARSKIPVQEPQPLITLTKLKKAQAETEQKIVVKKDSKVECKRGSEDACDCCRASTPELEEETKKVPVVKAEKAADSKPVRQVTRVSRSRVSQENAKDKEAAAPRTRMSTRSSTVVVAPKEVEEDESVLYKTAISTPESSGSSSSVSSASVRAQNRKNEEISAQVKSKLPDGVIDFDADCGKDPFQVGIYAEDIFAYYKRREERFPIVKYLDQQPQLNKNMRSILVDWMVEVQESFELNHETMYLAVKLVDLYLSKATVRRERLQLVGATALYISAKYDERSPPVIDDFCYICDDAYNQRDILSMERSMLKTLNYDIGIPLSYRFLRRYSRCAKLDMETLTLARYILETCLMNYEFIDVKDSMLASSSLLLALIMKGVVFPWSKTLEYYSGYSKEDIFDLTHRVHEYMSDVPSHLKTIKAKYSHKVFFEVAKVPLPEELQI